MKKVLALLLALVMAFSLAACDGGSSRDEDEKDTNKEKIKNDEKEDDFDVIENAFESDIVGTVLLDNEDYYMEITGFDPEAEYGEVFRVLIENKSETTLTFDVSDASVNGVESFAYCYEDVAPGKKSITTIDLDVPDVVKKYTDIKMEVTVYETDIFDVVERVSVELYPYGEDNVTKYERKADKDDIEIFDNEYMTITCIGADYDEWGDYVMELYIENKSDITLSASVEDMSVNGYMTGGHYLSGVRSGNVSFDKFVWYEDSLLDMGIEEFEKVEGTMDLYDFDSFEEVDEIEFSVEL